VTEPKLKAKLWVQAALRRCMVEGIMATVARTGDADAGTIVVKLYRGAAGCEVFTQIRDGAGHLAWLRATGADPVPEDRADSYIARAREVDGDLWVIEVEDRAGRVPFLERILPAK
jgi:GMP synthase (glutamine-hydrolysing)